MNDLVNVLSSMWQTLPAWFQHAFLIILGAAGGVLVTLFKDALTGALQQLGGAVQSIASSSWKDYVFERHYLNWVVAEHKDLKLVGVQTLNKPMLEHVFVSLRVVPLSVQGAPDEIVHLSKQATTRDAQTARERSLSIGEVVRATQKVVILGDPGAGKTTLLQFVALSFARERASEPTFRQRGSVKRKLGSTRWRLPLFVPLRSVVAEKGFVDWPTLIGLSPHLTCPDGYFERQLERGRCIVLLDGLDEVQSDADHTSIAAAIQTLSAPPYNQNQYLVSCRIAGWRNRLPSDFAKVVVRDFDQSEIDTFIHSWYHAVESSMIIGTQTAIEKTLRDAQVKKRAEELSNALSRNERLYRLARNPLLLSLIAIVHRTRVVLPRQRAKLYRECTELLLEQWDIARGVQVDDIGLNIDQKMVLMRAVAYYLQEMGQPQAPRRDIETIISTHLTAMNAVGINTSHALRMLEQRSGLIMERSMDTLAFAHLTFQEYFAAQAVAHDRSKLLTLTTRNRMFDPKWREVVLLYVGVIEDATDFIRALYNPAEEDLFANRLRLAARCLNDAIKLESLLKRNIIATLLQTWYDSPFRLLRQEISQVIAELDSDEVSQEMSHLFQSGTLDLGHYVTAAFAERTQHDPAIDLAGVVAKLKHPDPIVRQKILAELGNYNLQEPEIITALLTLLGSNTFPFRHRVVPILANVHEMNEQILDALIEQCNATDKPTRQQAIRVVGDVGVLSAKALEVLTAALYDSDEVTNALAAHALGKLGQGTMEVIAGLQNLVTRDSIEVRLQAARTLYILNHYDEGTHNQIRRALVSTDWLIRRAAADILCEIARPDLAMDLLIELVYDQKWQVQVSAIHALTTMQDAPHLLIRKLTTCLTNPQKEVRESATIALIRLGAGNDALVPHLADMIGTEDVSVRYTLVKALAHLASQQERWLAFLCTCLADPSPLVRSGAIVSLGDARRGTPEVIHALEAVLTDTTYIAAYTTTVQQLAFEALYQIHVHTGVWIAAAVATPTPERFDV